MKKTTKLTLISILTIALCISLIVGATFALFTDEKSSGIDVNAGVVQLDINDEKVQLDVWSAKWSDADGAYINDHKTLNADNRYEFTAGGFASLDSETLALDLERMVPGDGAKLTFGVTNNSNILIKYRLVISIEDNGLLDSLEISYTKDNANIELNEAEDYLYSDWFTTADADVKDLGTFSITVQLPMGTDNRAQDKSCSIDVSVFAVQINGQITDTEKLKEKEVVLNSALLDGVVATGIDSKSLVVGSWSTYADVVGGEFKEGALVANNNNVRAFEHDDKVYVLVYGTLVADTDYDNVNTDCLFYMFDFEHVDLSDVDFSTLTSTSLGYMFENSKLKSVNLAGANLSQLTNIDFLFAYCGQLEEVNFSRANLENVVGGEYDAKGINKLFHGCSSLKKVDFSYANLSKVEKMASMFWNGSRSLVKFPVDGNGSYNTGVVASVPGCHNLEEVSFAGATFNNLTNLNSFLEGTAIESFTLSEVFANVDLSHLQTVSDFFKDCESLKSVNFSNAILPELTTVSTSQKTWFNGCKLLTDVDFSNAFMPKVSTLAWFYISSTTQTPNLQTALFTGATFEGATTMANMFRGCELLETIDFSDANISGAKSMSYAFQNCTNLKIADFSSTQLDSVSDLSRIFLNCPNLVEVNFAKVLKSKITSMTEPFSSTNEHLEIIDFSDCDFSGIGAASNVGPLTIFSSSKTPILKSVNFSGCNFLGTSANNYSSRFSNITTLETADFSNSKLPTTTVSGMFSGCTALTTVNFSGADLSSVKHWGNNTAMFKGCTALTTVDFSNVKFLSMNSLASMFSGVTALTSVNFANATFQALTDTSSMFSGCSVLSTVDFTNVDFSKVTTAANMFKDCASLATVDLSTMSSALQNATSMFYGCTILEDIPLNIKNLSGLQNATTMFYQCEALRTVDFSGAVLSELKTIDNMFQGCTGITTVKFVEAVFSAEATYSSSKQPFNGCTSLKTANFSGVTGFAYMGNMFKNCAELTTVDFSNARLGTVTSATSMFSGCTSLENIDFSGVDFKLLTWSSTSSPFYNASTLKNIDLSGAKFNTVTSLANMFKSCSALVSVDFSGAEFLEVTEFSNSTSNLLFGSSANLTTVNFSGAKLPALTSLKYAFYNCSVLETLNLTGIEVADAKVTDVSYAFSGCKKLQSVDISVFDLSEATTAANMFYNCAAMEAIDLSTIDLSSVATTTSMFYGCSKLETIDLWEDLSKIDSANSMFGNCSALKHIYVIGDVDLSGMTTGTNLFTGCSNLTGYTSSKISKVYAKTGEGGYFENR